MKIKVEAVQHMLSLEAGKWTKLKSNAVHAVVTSDGFTVIDGGNSNPQVPQVPPPQLTDRKLALVRTDQELAQRNQSWNQAANKKRNDCIQLQQPR